MRRHGALIFCFDERIHGRVEEGRGGLGRSASPRLPSPLIKPDVRVSRIRLSDWLHRRAHGGARKARVSSPQVLPSPCDTASSDGPGPFQVLSGSSPITDPRLLPKRTRSQGPSLRRRYPASLVLRPCPTPARTDALQHRRGRYPRSHGSLPFAQHPVPTCRAHYPDGPVRVRFARSESAAFCGDLSVTTRSGVTAVRNRLLLQPRV